VSVTWYTWLEQGRGGVPSDAVLERLARALELDDANREVLFLLAHDRPPPRKVASSANPVVTPALQRVLDSLSVPAFVRTATFQIVAWNRASVLVFGDYAHVPERDRNLLRRVFGPGSETKVHDAEDLRRRCVAAFRIEVARAGASDEATALIDELSAESADFRRLWAEGEVKPHGQLQKRLVRPEVGEIALESSVFHIDGSAGLSMFVWSPVNERSAEALARLVARGRPRP
jgi:hypothetical protein